MSGFPFNERKALAAVLFILKEMGGKVDKHKLAKILCCISDYICYIIECYLYEYLYLF